MSGSGVLSEIVDKVSFATYLPLLSKATADDNDATPGYMFEEVNDISFQPSPNCLQLHNYLTKRLERPSACVKLKVLKIIFYVVKNGHHEFRQILRRNDATIKLVTLFNGVPDPLLGLSHYEIVRKTAQDLLDFLFDPELINKEDVDYITKRIKPHMGGLGSSTNTQGKYEGFGNSPRDKADTIKGKVIDIIDKFVNPVDETAKTIQSALTSSPGDYEPVAAPQVTVCEPDVPPLKSVPIRCHVPGKAGGGWDSDDEDFPLGNAQSPSDATIESLEIIDAEAAGENAAEKTIVVEFCKTGQWPLPLESLHDVCQKCADLNCVNVMKAISEILEMEVSTSVTKIRALLIVEWFLRKDLVSPSVMLTILSPGLDQILNEGHAIDKTLLQKTKKVKLIINRLADT